MTDLVVPFITGLTTGGLSCLAVQGGLLASSVVSTTEKEIQQTLSARHDASTARRIPGHHPTQHSKKLAAKPILIFLGAKLVAYTALGYLIGMLGAVLQLSSFGRGVMQIVIGMFMLGTALNMLKVHPLFRYFVIEPPRVVTRYIRRISKNSTDDVVTPAFLGALTVLIPCGVTQTMMALAIGSADPFTGAAILFAFTLGTSPLFFALAYLMRKLGQAMEARFMKVAAIAVLILALVSIDGGLNLTGSPISFSSLGEALLTPSNQLTTSDNGRANPNNVITINVAKDGYIPKRITALAGKPATLKLVTKESYSCARAFTVPSLGIQKNLPATGETLIDLSAQPVGTLRFTCGMGMYSGQIDFVADYGAPQSGDCDPNMMSCLPTNQQTFDSSPSDA